MDSRLIPFSYVSKKTFLHKTNAAIKLLFLLLITTSVVLVHGSTQRKLIFVVFVCITLFILCAASFCKIKMFSLLRGIKPILFLLLFVTLFRSVKSIRLINFLYVEFDLNGFITSVFFSWSILIAFCSSALLFAVTTITELKNALYKITRSKKLALGISVMLNFIPRFFVKWDEAKCAYRARAGKKGIAEIIFLVPFVTQGMMYAACKTADAVEMRGGGY